MSGTITSNAGTEMYGNVEPSPPVQVVEEAKDDKVAEGGEYQAYLVPPTAVLAFIEKLAPLVERIGKSMEKRVAESNVGNPKFSFLNASDPYHAYYQHRVAEICAKLEEQRPFLTERRAQALVAEAAERLLSLQVEPSMK